MRRWSVIALLALAACGTDGGAPEPTLRKLPRAHYRATVRDLLGPGVTLPTDVPADLEIAGYAALGASVEALAPRGVEQYEAAAWDLARQALADPAFRDQHVPCAEGEVDEACTAAFLRDFGRRAWRRPLTDDEVQRLVAVVQAAEAALDGAWAGLEAGLAAQLMSPHFLYRVELGEDDPRRPGRRRFTDWEMASRLSYFLWGTTPDDALLEAAEQGELVRDEGLTAQAVRLLQDDRAVRGLSVFFVEMLQLDELDTRSKDSTTFPLWHESLPEAAREQTLRTIVQAVFEEEGDYRDLLVRETSVVPAALAAVYGLDIPPDATPTELPYPAEQRRRGLLGQVSFLAAQAHPTSSSATLRGRFVMERLLCEAIPSAPGDVDTTLPEASAAAPTLRDRVANHLTLQSCVGCHAAMDPIGLAFEHFDGLGQHRVTEGGAAIDASGALDGHAFADAWELAAVLRDDARLSSCLTRSLRRFALGSAGGEDEEDEVERLDAAFSEQGYRVLDLALELIRSPAFREAGALPDAEGGDGA